MIPPWNAYGLLPPIRPGETGGTRDRSPYEVTLVDIIERLGTTPERRVILGGFLKYRIALHGIGLTEGFQWLDGSFMEDIEKRAARAPNDIDIVTFFVVPEGETQVSLMTDNSALFHPHETKKTYKVDAFFMELNKPLNAVNTEFVAYWYSMWSHTRTQEWKGFLKINLSPEDDKDALKRLTEISNIDTEGGIQNDG